MANTIIKVPGLIPGLSYTIDALDPSDGSVLQSGIALTLTTDATGATGTGTVTAAVAQKAMWLLKESGNIAERPPRVRTIADDDGPYTILTGLDTTAGTAAPPTLVAPSHGIDRATGWMVCYDEFGEPENGVDITIQLTGGNGVAGISLDTEKRTQTSATVTVDGVEYVGYVSFPGLPLETTWSVVRGAVVTQSANSFGTRSLGTPNSFEVPSLFADPENPRFPLPQILGSE